MTEWRLFWRANTSSSFAFGGTVSCQGAVAKIIFYGIPMNRKVTKKLLRNVLRMFANA